MIDIGQIVRLHEWLDFVQGLVVVMMIAVWLRLASCDSRIGALLTTLRASAPDLAHFFVLLALLLVLTAAMGHVLIGPHLMLWSTFQYAIESVFTCMVAGELSNINMLVRLLPITAPLPPTHTHATCSAFPHWLAVDFCLSVNACLVVRISSRQSKDRSVEMNTAERLSVNLFYFFMPVMFLLIILSILLAILVDSWEGVQRRRAGFGLPAGMSALVILSITAISLLTVRRTRRVQHAEKGQNRPSIHQIHGGDRSARGIRVRLRPPVEEAPPLCAPQAGRQSPDSTRPARAALRVQVDDACG